MLSTPFNSAKQSKYMISEIVYIPYPSTVSTPAMKEVWLAGRLLWVLVGGDDYWQKFWNQEQSAEYGVTQTDR